MTHNIGQILLSVLLILLALGWLSVVTIPPVVLGVLALVTAVFLLIGR